MRAWCSILFPPPFCLPGHRSFSNFILISQSRACATLDFHLSIFRCESSLVTWAQQLMRALRDPTRLVGTNARTRRDKGKKRWLVLRMRKKDRVELRVRAQSGERARGKKGWSLSLSTFQLRKNQFFGTNSVCVGDSSFLNGISVVSFLTPAFVHADQNQTFQPSSCREEENLDYIHGRLELYSVIVLASIDSAWMKVQL